MKFGVVVFPGSAGGEDMVYVLRDILEQDTVTLWHEDEDLQGANAVILPGGFSYGDYLRPGAIARFSPIMRAIMNFAQEGGFVLGVGNGFQILCESGLLPGALLPNINQRFICKNTFIRVDNNYTILTSKIEKNRALKIPVAHGHGRYYADTATLARMRQNRQILFRYCDENVLITEGANPDGSVENIAGICNEKKNVYGMMPHLERAADDELGNTDGRLILESIINTL